MALPRGIARHVPCVINTDALTAMASPCQWLRIETDPFLCKPGYFNRIEIKPGKHPETRRKPLPLASGPNGHGRYITATPETGTCVRFEAAVTYNCYKFITASLLKRWNGYVTTVSLQWPRSKIDPFATNFIFIEQRYNQVSVLIPK